MKYLAFIIVAFLLLLPLSVKAHLEAAPSCYDWMGRAVTYAPISWQFLAEQKASTAMATVIGNRPMVLYDYKEFDRLDDLTRYIILAHECAHHQLKHLETGKNYPMLVDRKSMELQADCSASNRTRIAGIWTFAELEAAIRKHFWQHDVEHGDLEERVTKYKTCSNKADVAQ